MVDAAQEWMRRREELLQFDYDKDSVEAIMLLVAMKLPRQTAQNIMSNADKPLTVKGMFNSIMFHYNMEKMSDMPFEKMVDGQTSETETSGTYYMENKWNRGASSGKNRGRSLTRRNPYDRRARGGKSNDFRPRGGNSNGFNRRQNSKNQYGTECWNCGEYGHRRATCKNKPSNKESGALLGSTNNSKEVSNLQGRKQDLFSVGDWSDSDDNTDIAGLCTDETEYRLNSDHNEGVQTDASLFVGCMNSQKGNSLKRLVYESFGWAVLDCGCANSLW